MSAKKYYTIGEVTRSLEVSASQLRYVEKILPKLSVSKIKGRRYYTIADIELIKGKIGQLIIYNKKLAIKNVCLEENSVLNIINNLISNFTKLSLSIKNTISARPNFCAT
ncbi:MAG: MerR family transcriptional regulator [Janthinobacterium lividum]